MKRVGVITMHRVQNCGSTLQAYALQKKIQLLGFDVEIIDYLYPNKEHSERQKIQFFAEKNFLVYFFKNLIAHILLLVSFGRFRDRIHEVILRNQIRSNFRSFWKRNYNLSTQMYCTFESIKKDPPSYDIYVVGSDQVWNPKYMVGDSNFLLDFAPTTAQKVSFASSMSVNKVAGDDLSLLRSTLKSFDYISVREKSTVDIFREKIGLAAEYVCDPTFLLSGSEWKKFCCIGSPVVRGKYLLVYVLDYSMNPYPEIIHVIRKLQQRLGLHVVVLDALNGLENDDNVTYIRAYGPDIFLNLFYHANFVLTSSFHGTAFSLNFEKNFYSVVRNKKAQDCRIVDFLQSIGRDDNLLELDSWKEKINAHAFYAVEDSLEKLNLLKQKSVASLNRALLS